MAKVPYQPFPSADLQPIGAPAVGVPAIADAFGENIARSVEGLGKTTEGVGNELFARAVAMQQLANDTEAKEADSRYMVEAGKLHAKFSSLSGKEAVDAQEGYFRDLDRMRRGIRETLSNDMARKMYDGSSLSTMGRTIFNGAGHAASENKRWAIGTAQANIDLDAKTVEDNPQDEALFQEKLQRVNGNIEQLSSLNGFESGGVQEEALKQKALSKIWSQRIVGLSRTKPSEARDMLEKNKTQLTMEDYLKVDNSVRSTSRAVDSVNIANGVYEDGRGDDGKPQKSLDVMEDEVRKKADKLDPDDPILAQHAVTALRTRYNQSGFAKRQEELENKQIVNEAIIGGVKTEQELRADPKIAAAIDALPANIRRSIPGWINNYNQQRDKVAHDDRYNQLVGQSNNDVEGFLSQNPFEDKFLNAAQMRQIYALQNKIKARTSEDPRVNRALGWIRTAKGSELEALGIYRRTESNKDEYDHYTGALQSAIDVWQESKGKPPNNKEVTEEIAPQVLRQRTEPAWFGLSTRKKPFYEQDVPEAFSNELKADVKDKTGIEPSDEQVYKAFIRMQMIKLYSKPKSEAKP